MYTTILDCYTDEAAGLGVPPYLGVYARYIAGYFNGNVNYLTIDDLRLWKKYNENIKKIKPSKKTQIDIYNLSKNDAKKILENTKVLIIILGVHVPGKYLSAVPGTLKEVTNLIKDLKCRKILTGPAIFGSQLQGGKFREKIDKKVFDEIDNKFYNFTYEQIKEYSVKGANILKQIPDLRIIEIETGRGCNIGNCSFCTEPIKNKFEFRKKEDILNEIKAFYDIGARYFRLGKQSCFYSYPEAISLLEEINKNFPKIKVLHIDNVNPVNVVADKNNEITKAIVKYCSSGNIAALGVESFDKKVVKANNLNTIPEVALEAVKIINKYGRKKGKNGLPKYLPGINLIYGLIDEDKETNKENLKYLKKIIDNNLLLRRINIRQVAIFEGTKLWKEAGNKFLRKNKKYYYRWRDEIRQEIDNKMLEKIAPINTVLKDCYSEIYDGNTTFLRQIGTYPLIISVGKRIELKKFYNVKVKGYMLRSLIGEIA